MDKLSVIGLDLAKYTFHVVGLNRANKMVSKRKLRRTEVIKYFQQQSPTVVAMEASRGAHYWARELMELGHQVKLLSPRDVKPFVQGQKNDYNDALAIAEASMRPKIRYVKVKSVQEQDMQSLHRLKEGLTRQRTQLCNQVRGLLSEYGLVIAQGISRLRANLSKICHDKPVGISDAFHRLLKDSYQRLKELDKSIQSYEKQIIAQGKNHDPIRRLQTIPGFGPIVSSVFYNVIGNGQTFARGRDASANIGLVPRQHTSGDKPVLLGISKRGNRQLRTLLIHGARSVVNHAHKKDDRLSRWVVDLVARRGKNKATVALANKLARVAWAILVHGGEYQHRVVAKENQEVDIKTL